jgi:hypothetical protein
MQWMQAAFGIYFENSQGNTLAASFGGPELAQATWLSLLGVLVLALGMWTALLRTKTTNYEAIDREMRNVSPLRVFQVFLVFFVLSNFLSSFAFRIPGLTQIIFAASSLGWIPVILLIQAVLYQQRGYGLLLFMVALEFGSGLLGFFSGFKSIFFILAVLLLTWRGAMPKRRIGLLVVMTGFLIFFGSVWQSVKGEYREFLNQGNFDQSVREPVGARVKKLTELTTYFNGEQLADGFDEMLQRMSYVTFFADCIKNVPSMQPYENGALWLDALGRVFMPRLLFPNKSVVDDSERTRKYAAVDIAGSEHGTSMSLGYMAESYVDFGPVGMFAPVFMLGIFYGSIYRIFALRQHARLIAIACALTILVFGAYTIETSNIKLIGINTMSVLVLGLFYWLFGAIFLRFVSEPNSARADSDGKWPKGSGVPRPAEVQSRASRKAEFKRRRAEALGQIDLKSPPAV